MKKYEHIFFDLDHTLWDYETNSQQTLSELYRRFDLDPKGGSGEKDLIEHFNVINEDLWDQYNKGQISQYVLRNSRFARVFESAGINSKLCSETTIAKFNECYLKECSQKRNLIDGTIEVLEYLHQKYILHIITNGFEEVQSIKIDSSGIAKYFEEVITSERAGAKKPFPAIYDFSLKVTKAPLGMSLMIGDNLKTDIKGALDYGMDQVYFNPKNVSHDLDVTHEVQELRELLVLI